MGRYGPLCLPIMEGLVRTQPFEAISMPQDDSKQWEHLLSQENDPSWADLAQLNLHLISKRSQRDLGDLVHESNCQKKATRAAESDEHETLTSN